MQPTTDFFAFCKKKKGGVLGIWQSREDATGRHTFPASAQPQSPWAFWGLNQQVDLSPCCLCLWLCLSFLSQRCVCPEDVQTVLSHHDSRRISPRFVTTMPEELWASPPTVTFPSPLCRSLMVGVGARGMAFKASVCSKESNK